MARTCLAIGLVLVALLALWSARLGGQDDHHRAKRRLLWHGVACEPKIVDRNEGRLQVVCADGKHALTLQPLCDESWLCRLGLEVACWDYEPG